MHELSIAQDLFKIVREKAMANNLKRITKIRIKVGAASGIEEDLLMHSFIDHIFPGTIAEGAVLEFIKEPVEAKCKNCGGLLNTHQNFGTTCPTCGSFDIEILRGKDIYLESMEGDGQNFVPKNI